jgi:hypothetical protein
MTQLRFPLSLLAAVISEQLPPEAVPADRWTEMIGLANRHGVSPMLLYCIRKTGFELPDAELDKLREVARISAARNAALEAAQVQIEAALRRIDLPTIWIKGIVLARLLYPDPFLRPMSDIDVLVPFDRRKDALVVAQAEGYRFPDASDMLLRAHDRQLLERVSHHYHLVGGPAGVVTLEIHGRLLSVSNEILSAEDIEWFWSQALSYHAASTTFSTLGPTAHLLYLCVHAEMQHADLYLLRYFDLHLLVTRTPPDWPFLIEQAVALRWTLAVESALKHCAEIFGTPVPIEALEQLSALRPAVEDIRRFEGLRSPGARWVRVHRLLGMLGFSDRMRLARKILLPAPSYMRARYAIPADQAIWPYYLRRWLSQVREVLIVIQQRFSH